MNTPTSKLSSASRRVLQAVALTTTIAACTTPPAAPAGAIVIEGRYFDGTGTLVERGEIVVHDGRIQCAGLGGECATAGAERITVKHGTILPGLIDLHVHARPAYVGAFPAAGVTTIRDANNTLDTIEALRAHADGPRVIASGPLLDGEQSLLRRMSQTAGHPGDQPWAHIMPVLVADEAQARLAVRELAQRGVDVIKLYDRLSPAAFAAAADEARTLGIPTMADLGMAGTSALDDARVDVRQAIDAGVDSVEHLSGFVLAYARLGGDPLAESLDPEILDRLVAAFAASGTAAVPTLANAVHFAKPDRADMDVPLAAAARTLLVPQWEQRLAWARDERARARQQADYRFARALLPRLAEAGVLIGAGTDAPAAPYTIPGGGIHQELAYLVDFGLSEKAALMSATSNAARIIGRDDLGVIRSGAVADLVAVAGNPLDDIRDSRGIHWVMMGGRLHEATDLRTRAFGEQR